MFSRGRHAAPRPRGMLRRFGRAIPLALAFMLMGAVAAFADTINTNEFSTTDDLVYGGGAQTASGTVPSSGTTTFKVSYTLTAQGGDSGPSGAGGNCNVSSGSSATLSFSGLPTGVSATGGTSWTACTTQDVTFTVTTAASAGTYPNVTPSLSGGTGSYTIHAHADFTLVLTGPATPSDTEDPKNASIIINDDDEWTNNTSVTVDIAATDNVGVTKYRLATTQVGLDTATDVTVTSSTNFADGDLTFTLAGPDGTNSAWVRFFDAAGNSADATDTIGLDRTKPVISGSTGTYVPGAWTNQSVSVSFTCADAGSVQSGIATDTVASADTTLSSDGEDQSVGSSGSCIDNAGNAADGITVSNIDIDKTKPTSGVSGFTNGAVYNLGDTLPAATCSDSDNLSGIATGGTLSGPTGTGPSNPNGVGSFIFSCNGAVDNAGNVQTTADTKSYTVQYNLTGIGILQPINPDNSSLFSRGKAVPVKFKMNGSNPYDMTGWKLVQQQVGCSLGGDNIGESVEAVAANPSNSFRYDSSADQYIYNANFKDKALGTCWMAGVQFDSGQTIWSAIFQLQK